MKELALGEAEAFRRLRKAANSKNLKLIEMARTVLSMNLAARTP
ncbi:MAG: ANTAR domain-containing protein [Gemmataceae bacterium]